MEHPVINAPSQQGYHVVTIIGETLMEIILENKQHLELRLIMYWL